jgi:hypothetical protein
MTGPAIFGDPIDPNEPISEPGPVYYPNPWTGGQPHYAGQPQYAGFPGGQPQYPGYPGYLSPPPGGYQPWDGVRPADVRPGAVITAAVLSLATAGLLLITGFVVIFAASSLESAENAVEDSQRTTLFVGAGLVNVIAAALLIIGGVALLNRSRAGRSALVVGTLLCLALGAFWLTEDRDGGIVVWLFIFCAPPLLAGVLACTARVTTWLGPAR